MTLSDCWRWPGLHRQHDGRPMIGKRYAYRVIWESLHGPTRLKLHHRCENVWCINPGHLEPLTQSDHAKAHGRGGDWGQAKKTHCPAGHEYTPENTYTYTGRGKVERACRTCLRDKKRERRAARL